MSTHPLLIELRTEELPPKALARLAEAFANGVFTGLSTHNLITPESTLRWFATPRRLALRISHVASVAAAKEVREKLMPVAVGLDAQGQPTQALLKKLAAKGIASAEIAHFERLPDGKTETLFYTHTVAGLTLESVLSQVVSSALSKLPIPKLMRWGDSDDEFVRPVHSLIMLHGTQIVAGKALGLESGNRTQGHRFLAQGDIVIHDADSYERQLEEEGRVLVDFAVRRTRIAAQLAEKAEQLHASLKPSGDLLDEVTALVEWPVVYVSEFEVEYLEVPQECLILTMQQNQKYFPLLHKEGENAGKLTNRFLIVSNMAVADPRHIVTGNARVVRPRLADARFFYNQDRKNGFTSRALKLSAVVYHNKLGSLADRAQRLGTLAGLIAEKMGASAQGARNAGLLCKVDLLTDIVGEFPELQGIMGRYYALHEGVHKEVADAIEQHYRPRFSGDVLPANAIASALALADKLDALVGFFGIGQIPTGDKDPFGLRRAALGILRILIETPLALSLPELIHDAYQGFPHALLTQPVETPLLDFMRERLRGLLKEAGHTPEIIDAVLAQPITRLDHLHAKLSAVKDFLSLPEAHALAAANKRIGNILKKAEGALPTAELALCVEDAEKALFARVATLTPIIAERLAVDDYSGALRALADVRHDVDRFFDDVMVNAEDPRLRANRLGLLQQLFALLNAVADIAKLSQ